jgi:hypothetical protein
LDCDPPSSASYITGITGLSHHTQPQNTVFKCIESARHQWLTPVILATQEAEIKRITVQSQPRQIVLQDPISKKPFTKKGMVEWIKVKALSSSPSTAGGEKMHRIIKQANCSEVITRILKIFVILLYIF